MFNSEKYSKNVFLNVNKQKIEAFTNHVVLVFQENGQFFKEGNHQHQQLLIIAVEKFDQQSNDVFVSHLQFSPRVLSKVEQKIKRDWQKEEQESWLSFAALFIELQIMQPRQ